MSKTARELIIQTLKDNYFTTIEFSTEQVADEIIKIIPDCVEVDRLKAHKVMTDCLREMWKNKEIEGYPEARPQIRSRFSEALSQSQEIIKLRGEK